MGINLHAFNYLIKIAKETEFKRTLTIGRQKISADKFSFIKKIYNYFRKLREFKYNKLNKFDKNLKI